MILPTLDQTAIAAAFFFCGMRMALLYVLMGCLRPARSKALTAVSDVIFCLAALFMYVRTALHICDGEVLLYTFLCVFVGFLLQFLALCPIMKKVRYALDKAAQKRAERKRRGTETDHEG